MNATNNKKTTTSILITAIATAVIMVLGPVAGANPVFALGHFHEGDNGLSSQEYDKFEDCLSDLEHETEDITEEQIEDCIDSAYNGESDESSREDNDDSDDDDRKDMLSEEEDEQEEKEDLAFFGDESEDSSSNNFNNDSDFADDENSSTG